MASFVSSIVVGKVGLYQPFFVSGSIFTVIGAGLSYTFNLDTGLGSAIGYQILFGVGRGVAIQVPVIVAGVVSATEDNAVALSTELGELFRTIYLL